MRSKQVALDKLALALKSKEVMESLEPNIMPLVQLLFSTQQQPALQHYAEVSLLKKYVDIRGIFKEYPRKSMSNDTISFSFICILLFLSPTYNSLHFWFVFVLGSNNSIINDD